MIFAGEGEKVLRHTDREPEPDAGDESDGSADDESAQELSGVREEDG